MLGGTIADKQAIKEFIGDQVELTDLQLRDLKNLLGDDKDLAEYAMDLMVQHGRVTDYMTYSRIDDYSPMNNNPYDVVAAIGKGSDKAIEICLGGMQTTFSYAQWSAMRHLPKITPPERKGYVASHVAAFLKNEYEKVLLKPSMYSHDLLIAVDVLLELDECGFKYLDMYLSGRYVFSKDIKRLVRTGISRLPNDQARVAREYFWVACRD